jgi:hypothetical protein
MVEMLNKLHEDVQASKMLILLIYVRRRMSYEIVVCQDIAVYIKDSYKCV